MRSILIPLPEADRVVDRFRLRGDWSRRVGVPAHITLAGPFPLSLELPMERLASVARRAMAIRVSLSEVGRVGDSTCLLVADEAPLAVLRSEALDAIGAQRRAAGPWAFHLTIARGESADTEAAIGEALEPGLPLTCAVPGLAVATLRQDRLDLDAVAPLSADVDWPSVHSSSWQRRGYTSRAGQPKEKSRWPPPRPLRDD